MATDYHRQLDDKRTESGLTNCPVVNLWGSKSFTQKTRLNWRTEHVTVWGSDHGDEPALFNGGRIYEGGSPRLDSDAFVADFSTYTITLNGDAKPQAKPWSCAPMARPIAGTAR